MNINFIWLISKKKFQKSLGQQRLASLQLKLLLNENGWIGYISTYICKISSFLQVSLGQVKNNMQLPENSSTKIQ
jgi:hypothetical protein